MLLAGQKSQLNPTINNQFSNALYRGSWAHKTQLEIDLIQKLSILPQIKGIRRVFLGHPFIVIFNISFVFRVFCFSSINVHSNFTDGMQMIDFVQASLISQNLVQLCSEFHQLNIQFGRKNIIVYLHMIRMIRVVVSIIIDLPKELSICC